MVHDGEETNIAVMDRYCPSASFKSGKAQVPGSKLDVFGNIVSILMAAVFKV